MVELAMLSSAASFKGEKSKSVALPNFRPWKRKGGKSFINFAWGPGDEIALFASKPKSEIYSEDRNFGGEQEGQSLDSRFTVSESTLVALSWDQSPSETRSIVRQGYRTFTELESYFEVSDIQRSVSSNAFLGRDIERENNQNGFLLDCSRRLRSSLSNMLLQLEMRLDLADQTSGSDELSAYFDKMKLGNMCWHLCEILLFNQAPLVGISLVNWVYEHFPRIFPEEEKEMEISIRRLGSNAEHFWSTIYSKALRGDTRGAWNYLKLDSRYVLCKDSVENSVADIEYLECINAIRDILLSFPRWDSSLRQDLSIPFETEEEKHIWLSGGIDDTEGITSKEVQNRMTVWNRKVVALASSCEKQCPEIQVLLSLLRGDVDVLMSILNRNDSDCWAHILAACLLYYAPTTKKNELRELVESCFEFRFMGGEQEQSLLLSIFEADYSKSLQLLHTINGDRWLSVHFCEILSRAGAIESVHKKPENKYLVSQDFLLGSLEVDMREYFILEYAMQLALKSRKSHSPINWRYALAYLKTLTRPVPASAFFRSVEKTLKVPLGFAYGHIVIERQFPISDLYVSKLINECNQVGLSELGQSILRQRIMYWWCLGGGRSKYLLETSNPEGGETGFLGSANALLWSQKSGVDMSNSLLTLLFDHGSTSALNMLVEHMSISSHLTDASGGLSLDAAAISFLSTYQQIRTRLKEATRALTLYETSGLEKYLHDAWSERDMAASTLVKMLKWNNVPDRFRGAVIRDVILWETGKNTSDNLVSLVLKNPVSLSLSDTSVLINVIEQLEFTLGSKGCKNKIGIGKEELAAVRLNLLQSLARSVIMMGSVS